MRDAREEYHVLQLNALFCQEPWADYLWQGVFTNAAVEFGKIMDSPAFAVFSTGLLLIMLVLWIGNQVLTVRGIITGRILGLERGWDNRPVGDGNK